MGARQYGRALESYRRALQADPSGVSLYNSIGSAYSMMGADRDALPWLEKAVRYSPDDPEAWDKLGQSWLSLEDLPRAEKAFLRSIRLHEDDTNLLHAGITLADQGKDEEAIRLLRRALARNPENAEACFYLGSLLADHGGESEAVGLLKKSARAGFGPAQDALKQKGLAW
jgi:tetratricopeptide (TPR) repeat protein